MQVMANSIWPPPRMPQFIHSIPFDSIQFAQFYLLFVTQNGKKKIKNKRRKKRWRKRKRKKNIEVKSENENETTHFIFNYVIHIFMLQFTSTFLFLRLSFFSFASCFSALLHSFILFSFIWCNTFEWDSSSHTIELCCLCCCCRRRHFVIKAAKIKRFMLLLLLCYYHCYLYCPSIHFCSYRTRNIALKLILLVWSGEKRKWNKSNKWTTDEKSRRHHHHQHHRRRRRRHRHLFLLILGARGCVRMYVLRISMLERFSVCTSFHSKKLNCPKYSCLIDIHARIRTYITQNAHCAYFQKQQIKYEKKLLNSEIIKFK